MGFLAAVVIAGAQALLAMMIFEVGLALLIVEPARRRQLAWLHVVALSASLLCLRFPWLGPPVFVLPWVVGAWRSRRPLALGVLAGAVALAALGAVWSAASMVLLLGVAIPFLPIGVVLHQSGRPRAAVAAVAALAAGLGLMFWALGRELLGGHVAWQALAFAVAASPLTVFLFRERRPRVGLTVLVGVPAALMALSLLR